MPNSKGSKNSREEGEDSNKGELISQDFLEIDVALAVDDQIAEIDSMIGRIDELLLPTIRDLMFDDAYLEALEERVKDLIDGYEEPVSLIGHARKALKQARDILSTAKGEHAKLLSAVQASLQLGSGRDEE